MLLVQNKLTVLILLHFYFAHRTINSTQFICIARVTINIVTKQLYIVFGQFAEKDLNAPKHPSLPRHSMAEIPSDLLLYLIKSIN